jgi:hypothetical protein
MNNRPIHQNLDTSFVNLSALVKYLRRRQFVGSVKIQLNGYQAEIMFKADSQMAVREHDQISGLISEGKEAFQRLLIRAREPGGTINVFQNIKAKTKNAAPASAPKQNKQEPTNSEKVMELIPVEILEESPVPNPGYVPFKQPTPKKAAVAANGNGLTVNQFQAPQPKNPIAEPEPKPLSGIVNSHAALPDFPFELSNEVERKAHAQQISLSDWQNLLKISVELLGVVDRSLALHKLEFSAAFRKARAEIADDYPFMNPAADIFDYEKGRITMKQQINETIFVNSIVESLKRILEKLGDNPKFGIAHRDTSQLIVALVNKRKTYYDKFGLTVPLKRVLGI